ncbi:MAG: hypothetical protein COS58_02455 [Candidatus Tagabacteria bacterium CG03_land_8_20_14_0_80_41_22]|uniref:Adenylosuccinate synthetase n=2 Tax=Candidatus Tagaibacteriota TaxID=1817918 RepID=A0A2M7B8Q3_9BACT|nr:MAG: hypothetical protein COV90_01690 [Candidatus Tagabacteria bacterium CG11_big_fil_rev_8_21_14_0_20_41_11]PIU99463.1 MAG: hypothetical protein COS58_02455 [Candidatus Tagabacteria bacterium CG03_land_8_20_14_0_80_41_22]
MKHENFGRITIIVGMQYGSEGKGAITSYLAPGCSLGVRTGAANAGHTIYYEGQKFIMRQIPSVWVNPYAKLVIGVGAIISPDILSEEIECTDRILPVKNRIFIDYRAHVISRKQIRAEQRTDLAQRIGSTSATSGEGIGTATADKVLRKKSCVQAKDMEWMKPYLCDTVEMVNKYLECEHPIILEGTQGFGLSLEHGNFPYITSRDTSAVALAASIGVSPHYFDVQVIGVVRSYPIRVAGNSGSFGEDSEEITWDKLTKFAGADQPIIEMTSVTGKVRRVATFSEVDFTRACQVNRPTEIALTFADYLDWRIHEKDEVSRTVESFISDLENLYDAPVMLVKTGPETVIDYNWYRRSMLRKIR